MMRFRYTRDAEIEIHRQNAIRQMCTPFLSHEAGLPEWIKNSAAAYLNEGIPAGERLIFVLFADRRGDIAASISVLDLVGMTSHQIERNFRVWADPEAAQRSARVSVQLRELGGHGNGGKCYMTQMFENCAYLVTAKQNHGCRYGVAGGAVEFGYAPNVQEGKDFSIDNIESLISECLESARTNLQRLPADMVDRIRSATGFTYVHGEGPKGYEARIPAPALVESLVAHPQMVTAIRTCKIFIFLNGRPVDAAMPLSLPEIEPLEGFEVPREHDIPESLEDPGTGEPVSTTDNGRLPSGKLVIHTSQRSMVRARNTSRRSRHNVTYQTSGGFIGYTPMPEMDVQSAFRDYIYCEVTLESLNPFQTNERARLAQGPLTRAVEAWVAEKVREICREIENRDRRARTQEQRDEASRMNQWLDIWKNQLLQEVMQGLYGDDTGVPPRPAVTLPAGTPSKMELTCTCRKAGVGVTFRPSLRFYDREGKQIRAVPYRWVSDDTNVAMVLDDLLLIQTFSFGHTEIWAETLHGRLRSNKVPIEVVRILEVVIEPSEVSMESGTRRSFRALCHIADGEDSREVYLTWLENNTSVARVSASGVVYAFAPGTTEVTAMDDLCRTDHPALVTVVPAGSGGGGDHDRGRGFPKILLSEINTAPGEDEPQQFGPEIPPIWQRPIDVDNNIWWINMASPFARLYSAETGEFGLGSQAWRMYHVERVIDILVQIALSYGPDSSTSISGSEWITTASTQEAEIRSRAIDSLSDFIIDGIMD